MVPPLRSSSNATLVGENAWELVYGAGLSPHVEGDIQLGEYAVEYLKRLSPSWRVFGAIEGTDDEVSLIPEVQYFIRENIYLKFNVGVGLTPKATDVAPEIGVMFSF